jgi:hypothetical protein
MEPDDATVDGMAAEAGESGAIVALTGAAMAAGMGLNGGVAATDAEGAAEVVLGLAGDGAGDNRDLRVSPETPGVWG